jgi:hypothetical protein
LKDRKYERIRERECGEREDEKETETVSEREV